MVMACMCDKQRMFMIAQANAVAEYIKTQRNAGLLTVVIKSTQTY